MDEMELAWLLPTALQVVSLAMALGVLGLGYERATREKVSFIGALEQGHLISWLALAGVIFSIGLGLTQVSWGYKTSAIALAVILSGLALTAQREKSVVKTKATKQGPTIKSFGRFLLKAYLVVFLLLILVWGINLSWHAVNLYQLAKSLQADPTQVRSDTIVSLIGEATDDIRAIHQQLSPLFPIFNTLQGLPIAGQYLGQIEPLLRYADGLAQAGNEIALGLEPLLEKSSTGQAARSLPERASQVVQSGQAHFINAAQVIDQTSQMRSRIRPELLPTTIRALFFELDGRFELLVAGVQALQAAPQLLGADQAQNYLVLAQNRDELRATGGFISGIGLLTIQDGKILQFNLGDSYQVDDFNKAYPTPPEALKRFMLADFWVTRDANWSPDFPTTSQEAQSLYTLSTGAQTQGVIAFNQLALQRILELIGAVQVPGTDEPVTADNVEDYMRQAWAPAPEEGLSPEWWLHRKDFMQKLGNVILEKALSSGNQEQLLNLAKTMLELLDEGQLLVYFNDPQAQAALEAGGWDGGLHPGSNDYLYLVDTNVGFNKVDSIVRRSVDYQVDLSNLLNPTGEVTLTYQHTGTGEMTCKQEISYGSGTYQDMQQRCYLDYWRIYVQDGSKLLSSNAQPIPAEILLNGSGWSGQVESIAGEASTQVFAGLMMLPMAQTSSIEVSYSLPPSIVHSEGTNIEEYILRVQVQPGLEGLPFRLEIILPFQASPVSLSEGWKPETAQSWTWQGNLYQSTELSLSFQLNPQP